MINKIDYIDYTSIRSIEITPRKEYSLSKNSERKEKRNFWGSIIEKEIKPKYIHYSLETEDKDEMIRHLNSYGNIFLEVVDGVLYSKCIVSINTNQYGTKHYFFDNMDDAISFAERLAGITSLTCTWTDPKKANS